MNTIHTSSLQPAAAHTATTSGSSAPGSDVFMQILLAQMRHQNPLEPMKDSEMISQFSQLNSLETLVSMKDMLSEIALVGQIEYGAGLIGQQVRASRADGSILEGTVSEVNFASTGVLLTIGSEKVPLANIIKVSASQK